MECTSLHRYSVVLAVMISYSVVTFEQRYRLLHDRQFRMHIASSGGQPLMKPIEAGRHTAMVVDASHCADQTDDQAATSQHEHSQHKFM